MRKITSLVFAALFTIFVFAASDLAQAQRRPYSINHRETRQQKRIRQGVKSGELTAKETYKLERQQYKLRRTEARYRRSGDGLTARERYRLQRQENRTSRAIYRQKHDRQDYDRRRP